MRLLNFLFRKKQLHAAPQTIYVPPLPIPQKEYERKIRDQRIKEFGNNHRHKSFLATHSDKTVSQLSAIYHRLLVSDASLTDNEILTAYHKTFPFITNTIASAEIEFASIATICYYRPYLTEQLLQNGLLSLIYSYGDKITADEVESFINHNLLREQAEPYGGLPHTQGIIWLTQTIPTIKPQIQRVLELMIDKNRKELDQI